MFYLFHIYDRVTFRIENTYLWQLATKSIFRCRISMLLLFTTLLLLGRQAPIASPWSYIVVLILISILILSLALAISIGRKVFGD